MRPLLLLLFALLSAAPLQLLHGRTDPDCERPPDADMSAYKEEYVPIEYAPEPFAMEVIDLGLLTLLLLAGAICSRRRHAARWMTGLTAVGLAYFGLLRGGCVCPVGSVTNVALGLAAPELVGKRVAVLFLLPLLGAFLAGRIFCSTACPLGAVQHLLSRKRPYVLPGKLNAVLRLLPIGVLFMTVWGAWRGALWLACRLDVYKLIFFTGYAWQGQLIMWLKGTLVEPRLLLVGDLAEWAILAAVLLLGVFIPRPFCRFACPYGVLLGVMSTLGLRRRRVNDAKCPGCGRCEAVCPVQAISPTAKGKHVTISAFHCIQCGRCNAACKGSLISG